MFINEIEFAIRLWIDDEDSNELFQDTFLSFEEMNKFLESASKESKYDFLKAGSAGYVDGWLYTELVLRYHLPWHVFIQAMMKSHLTKVEFISLGLGFYY